MTLAANTPEALDTMATDLASHLELESRLAERPALADVAYTRAVGRAEFSHRRTVVAADVDELIALLRKPSRPATAKRPRVVFLFPGQGAASYGMAGDLYRADPAFREELDGVVAAIEPHFDGLILPSLLEGSGAMLDPRLTHPALFAVEYALARTWMRWGLRPDALLGHSFGEYAAACVAGMWRLEDAARMAVLRGELVTRMPEGAMLAVALAENELMKYLDGPAELAAVNGDGRCVACGPPEAMAQLATRLTGDNVASVPLAVQYAFHSAAVEPVLGELHRVMAGCEASPPSLPLISSLTGTWWAGDDGSPGYWARQMREPVRFGAALETAGLETAASGDDRPLFVEVGPDQALTALVRSQLRGRADAVASARRMSGTTSGHRVLLEAVGAVWRAGGELDWPAFYAHERRQRVPLPAYPFASIDCHLDAPTPVEPPVEEQSPKPAVEPEGDSIEHRVTLIWRERLGTDDFGVHDSFLELGGNSLMAAQMLTRLRDAFSVQLPMSALFDTPTVAGVSEQIRSLLGTQSPAASSGLPRLEAVPRTEKMPLSIVQERTLTLEAADPGNPALLMPIAVTMDGPLDVERLRAAAATVAARHETLCTTFHLEGGHWIQRPGAQWIGVEQLPDGTDPAEQAHAEATEPIDLSLAPLRIRLLRLDEQRHVLLLTLHHVISDTWSMLVFLRELAAAYEGAELAPITVQYADFAAWQRRNLGSGALAAQLDHWRRALRQAPPPLPLPVDSSRAQEQGCRSGRIEVTLGSALSGRVHDFCQRRGVTPFVAILAAYTALLSRATGESGIVVGTPIGNRDRPELEGLVGYVAHCVPLRTDVHDDPSFWELAQRTQQTLVSAYEYPDVPYEYLVAGEPGRLFPDAAFVLHSGLDLELSVAGMTWRPWDVPGLPAQFGATLAPLTLMLADRPDGFTGVLEYAAELFSVETAHRIADQLARLLDSAISDPRTPVSHLEVSSEGRR